MTYLLVLWRSSAVEGFCQRYHLLKHINSYVHTVQLVASTVLSTMNQDHLMRNWYNFGLALIDVRNDNKCNYTHSQAT